MSSSRRPRGARYERRRTIKGGVERRASPAKDTAIAAPPPSSGKDQPKTEEKQPDYSHVYRDIKHTGFAAGIIGIIYVIIYVLWK